MKVVAAIQEEAAALKTEADKGLGPFDEELRIATESAGKYAEKSIAAFGNVENYNRAVLAQSTFINDVYNPAVKKRMDYVLSTYNKKIEKFHQLNLKAHEAMQKPCDEIMELAEEYGVSNQSKPNDETSPKINDEEKPKSKPKKKPNDKPVKNGEQSDTDEGDDKSASKKALVKILEKDPKDWTRSEKEKIYALLNKVDPNKPTGPTIGAQDDPIEMPELDDAIEHRSPEEIAINVLISQYTSKYGDEALKVLFPTIGRVVATYNYVMGPLGLLTPKDLDEPFYRDPKPNESYIDVMKETHPKPDDVSPDEYKDVINGLSHAFQRPGESYTNFKKRKEYGEGQPEVFPSDEGDDRSSFD
jgi:DNA-binding protein H-NS